MLQRIQISTMGAFESFDSGVLPAVVLIDGDNGIGKTSLLDCVKWVGESGHDPDMIHGNAEFGEVIITTDDGTQLRVRTSREETTRSWKPKDGKRWIKGREAVEKIYRAIAYDPLAFLNLKNEKQTEMFASLAPVEASKKEIDEAVGEAKPEADGAKIQSSMSGLDRINAIRKAIYDSRTILNTGADAQEAHAKELERTLPPPAPEGTDWNAEAERIQREKEELEADERGKVDAIRVGFQSSQQSAKDDYQTACTVIDTDIDARIKLLEIERANRKTTAAETRDKAIEDARAEANRKAGEITEANGPALEKLTEDLGTAKERARAQQEAEGTRKAITAARDGAQQKRERSAVLTASIERLDALKLKLASLATEKTGAMLVDGRIVKEQDGGLVPLKRWNTAAQYTFCLRFGMMLGGGFVCVDHLEAYSDANQKALIETANAYAEERGVQFILAKVNPAGGPLRVAAATAQ